MYYWSMGAYIRILLANTAPIRCFVFIRFMPVRCKYSKMSWGMSASENSRLWNRGQISKNVFAKLWWDLDVYLCETKLCSSKQVIDEMFDTLGFVVVSNFCWCTGHFIGYRQEV